jgi:ABC-type multidrug transport system fused ATPase/permease subunit
MSPQPQRINEHAAAAAQTGRKTVIYRLGVDDPASVPRPGGGKKVKLAETLRNVRPLIWELLRPRIWKLVLVLALVMIGRAASLAVPTSTKYVVDDVVLKRDISLLLPIVLGILGAALIQVAVMLSAMRIMTAVAQDLIVYLRLKVQAHVLRLPLSYYDGTQSGALARRIIDDASGGRHLFGPQLIEFIGSLLAAIYSLMFLFSISAKLTATAMVGFVLFGAASRIGFKRMHPRFKDALQITAQVTGRLVESVGGIRVVKGYHAEAHEEAAFSAGVQRMRAATLRTLNAVALMSSVGPLGIGCVTALVIYLAATDILAGNLSLGGLVSFMAFMSFMMSPLLHLLPLGAQLAEGFAGLGQVQELLDEKTEHANPRRTYPIGRVHGDVAFDNVSFAYKPGEEVLHGITFEARPGTATALVGPSGSGKSTIIGLIAAFYEPAGGSIRVDDVDLSTVRLDSYRTQLGLVMQDNFLFSGSIRDNVMFARREASDEAFRDACRIAHVDEFAERFPEKYDTVVGERGVKLSMGQRQRISIARALLADPRILILDEATSSLDSESEAAIQEGLRHLMKGRTTFIIAHRLSTIQSADQILLIEKGRLIERGTHDALYAKRGRYYDLSIRQQLSGADVPEAPVLEPQRA